MGTKTLAASGGNYSSLTTMLDDIGDGDVIDTSSGSGEDWVLTEQDGGRWDIDAGTHRINWSNPGNWKIELTTIDGHAGDASSGFTIYSSTSPASGGKYHTVGIGVQYFCLSRCVVENYTTTRGAVAFTLSSDYCCVRQCVLIAQNNTSDNGSVLYCRDSTNNEAFHNIIVEGMIYLRQTLTGFKFCGNSIHGNVTNYVVSMIGTTGGDEFAGNAAINENTGYSTYDETDLESAFTCAYNLSNDWTAPGTNQSDNQSGYFNDPHAAVNDLSPTNGDHAGWSAPSGAVWWVDEDAVGTARAASRTIGALEYSAASGDSRTFKNVAVAA